MHRIVYLPIEKKIRELKAKTLIALELSRIGITTVIGTDRALLSYSSQFPCGLMCFKGINKVQTDIGREIKKMGFLPVATDEEALGNSNEQLIAQDCWKDAHSIFHKVFCQGAVHKETLRSQREFSVDQLETTGNVRVDLLRPPFTDALGEKVEEIRHRFGPFILVNTNSGGTNSKERNLDRYKEALIQIGYIDPSAPADLELLENHLNHDRNNVLAIKAFVRSMSRVFPERRIVLRPHPSERETVYRDLASETKNMEVVTGTDPQEWIMAADLLVQTGCTTGLEAAILGTPTISLSHHPQPVGPFADVVSNRINPSVSTVDELIEAIRRFDCGEAPEYGANKADKIERLSRYVLIDDVQYAFQKIAVAMSNALLNTPEPPEISPISESVDQAMSDVVDAQTHDNAYVDPETFNSIVRDMATTLGYKTMPTVKDLRWGVYKVEAQNNYYE